MKDEAGTEEISAEARRIREHEDGDAPLEELMSTFGEPVSEFWPVEAIGRESIRRENEFVCRSCHMVLHRSLVSDRERGLCVVCAGVPAGEVVSP